MSLSRTLQHLRKIEYLHVTAKDNVINSIQFLSLGKILRENVKRERGETTATEESFDFHSFPSEYVSSVSQTLALKGSTKNPLEVVNVRNFQSSFSEDRDSPEIALESSKVLCSSTLVPPRSSFEQFFQLQRQRKIWWMKFMYNPGQVCFANPTRTDASQSISIRMKTSHGFNVELERIELHSVEGHAKKASVLQSWFSLDTCVLSFLIDALSEIETNDQTLHLHQRLCPYKVILLVEDQRLEGDLGDLVKLIRLELEASNLKVLDRTQDGTTLAESLSRADQMGVPYNLIVGKESLENGLLKLRNRNTTLSEIIHLSDIPTYLERIVQGGERE